MVNPLQMAVSLPLFYFLLAAHAIGEGWMIAIQIVGIVSLLAGAILAIRHRRKDALLFLIPFVASEAFVVICAVVGRTEQHRMADIMTLTFLGVQLVLAGGLVWVLQGMRASASLLALFSLSYAAFAGFLGLLVMVMPG